MGHKLTVCAACLLMAGLFVTDAFAQAPALRVRTNGTTGRICGDLTAAGLPGATMASVAWQDYDGDGDLDFLIQARRGNDYVTRVYRNEGSAVFGAAAECVTTNGVTTCEGDQSTGVAISDTGSIELWVQNLTTDIAPSDSVPGIVVRSTGNNGSGSGVRGEDGSEIEVHFVDPNHAIIGAPFAGNSGMSALSQAGHGSGGRGGTIGHSADAGGAGGRGGDVSVENRGTITMDDDGAPAIVAVSRGGNGGSGGSTGAFSFRYGAAGGKGGDGGTVTVFGTQGITTDGMGSHGISALSQGGKGGNAGSSAEMSGGTGGVGGAGGSVVILGNGNIETTGDASHGIYARSEGGRGGNGGGGGAFGSGNGGAGGGHGGDVTVDGEWSIHTGGMYSHGIAAYSLGGGGGQGGHGGWFGNPGDGGQSGYGGGVSVNSSGSILTQGDTANGILAQSVGGYAGTGGTANVLVNFSADGGSGGAGGVVTVNNEAAIGTGGRASNAIIAQSIGGGGGSGGGGFGLFYSEGGGGSAGGSGDSVTVTNSGTLTTTGVDSRGIFAQSVGGGGGDGGTSGGIAAFGGRGAVTSDGGQVSVLNSGTISTGVDLDDPDRPQAVTGSQAIFAQSLGGGGGNGGSSGGWFTIGGSGGGGGDAGLVSVSNTGALTTRDDNSSAIFAQSVGGGGGNGGCAVSASGSIASVAIGGKGAGGGDGDSVKVESSQGAIQTEGNNSHGILAQSVGGGGGNGGFAIATSGPSTPVRVSVGGTGGPGGDGSFVNVQSGSDITTSGEDANGITAQSIGGGGGTGGFAVSANLAGGVAWNVAIGGSGGIGGDGSTVRVGAEDDPLAGSITTSGARSSGISAQSIGGGGGNAGFAVTGALLSAATIGVGLGGSGGAGGQGEDVDVITHADITTNGAAGHGILAQSIGGGGGAGGWSLAAGVTAFGGATVSLGGGGGAGSNSGVVDVENSGTIVTNAEFSHGIMAQSIGGGGGTGGMSGSAMVNFSSLIPMPPQIPVSVGANFAVAVGGTGGAGAVGDSVTVTNAGDIVTHGDFSDGIVAQSIGGGGGAGGKSIAATANIDVPNPGEDFTSVDVHVDFALALGGKGGSGNHGGAVEVNQVGRIETDGDGAHGIMAQSIGGGGGVGGSARAMTLGLDPSEWVGGAYVTPEVDITVNIGVGGSGGAGGDGGEVKVANDGNIVTAGADAHGIMAQSIGGGGGTGGGGFHGLGWDDYDVPESLIPDFSLSQFTSLPAAEIVVGGSGGSSGQGSTVDILNSGSILTLGAGSFGILAQSIGGGGGTAGVGAQGDGLLAVGGGGGSAGDGDSVSVQSSGTIETQGTAAHALFAQSIGGGGGIAGNIDRGFFDFGINFAIGQNGGSAGNGGAVDIGVEGDIVTHGEGSNGIFAQSVGGGGGLAGDLGFGFGYAGSAGGDGAGGEVHVNLLGTINTYGDGSHGIFAQSVGGANDFVAMTAMNSQATLETLTRTDRSRGAGHSASAASKETQAELANVTLLDSDSEMLDPVSHGATSPPDALISSLLADRADLGGAVTVEVDGDVLAHGARSHGIIAQSLGDDGNGNITIDILSGTVQGGTDSSVGVLMLDGAANLLSNHGTITTLDGFEGMAIRSTGGEDLIDNYGWITGSVDLGSGSNHFNNLEGATFESGSTIDLGSDGVLTNDGTFSPGGASATMATTLTGTYEQTSTGIFEATVSGPEHDQLLLGDFGDASLDGTLRIVADVDVYTDGTTYDIITAADSQQISGTFSNLDLPQTAFLDFSSEVHGGVLQLTVDVDSFNLAAANPLQSSIAQYLDACLADAQGDLARVIGAFQLATAEQVEEAFVSLSPDTYDNLTRGSAQSARLYQDALAQRLDAARFNPFAGEDAPMNLAFGGRNGWWLNGMHRGADQDASGGYQAHNFVSSGVLGGYERFYGTSIVGASIGATNTDVDRDNEMARGKVEAIGGSLYGTHVWGRNYAQGVIYYGSENVENQREIHLGAEERVAQSEYSGSAFSALITGGHRFDARKWGLEPFGSLRYIHVSEDGFTETGAQSVNLVVDPRSTDWLGSDLGIRLDRSFRSTSWAFVPELLLAWNYDFGIDDRTVTAAFEGAPSATFTIDGQQVQQSGATLGIGLSVVTIRGWGLSLRYDHLQRSDFQANDLSLRLGMTF